MSRRWAAALALVLALACRGGDDGQESAPDVRGLSSARDSAAPATPGRLAFSAAPPGSATSLPWSPSHPEAEVVAFTDAWPEPPGTSYLAVATGWADTVRFTGVTQAPYGCDGAMTSMAAFEGNRPAPEGPVWLAPLGSDVEAVALQEVLPSDEAAAASGSRGWDAGGAALELTHLGPSGARLTLMVDGAPSWSQTFEAHAMGEDTPPPVDFMATVPGIPRPIAAYRGADDGLPVVVLWRPGYEGHAFDLLRADADPPRLVEGNPVYYCAY